MGCVPRSQNSALTKSTRRAFVPQGRFRRSFSGLGPGLISDGASDDPYGLPVSSVPGASPGTETEAESTGPSGRKESSAGPQSAGESIGRHWQKGRWLPCKTLNWISSPSPDRR